MSHFFRNTTGTFLPCDHDTISLTRWEEHLFRVAKEAKFFQIPGTVSTIWQQCHNLYTRLITFRLFGNESTTFAINSKYLCDGAKATWLCKKLLKNKYFEKRELHFNRCQHLFPMKIKTCLALRGGIMQLDATSETRSLHLGYIKNTTCRFLPHKDICDMFGDLISVRTGRYMLSFIKY